MRMHFWHPTFGQKVKESRSHGTVEFSKWWCIITDRKPAVEILTRRTMYCGEHSDTDPVHLSFHFWQIKVHQNLTKYNEIHEETNWITSILICVNMSTCIVSTDNSSLVWRVICPKSIGIGLQLGLGLWLGFELGLGLGLASNFGICTTTFWTNDPSDKWPVIVSTQRLQFDH